MDNADGRGNGERVTEAQRENGSNREGTSAGGGSFLVERGSHGCVRSDGVGVRMRGVELCPTR